MLLSLAAAIPGLTATTQPRQWRAGHARLLLAEAFVSGTGKPPPLPAGQHAADAAAAALALLRRLDTIGEFTSDVRCSPRHPFNPLAAMAIWAGLNIDGTEIRQDVLVIRCTPRPRRRHTQSSARGPARTRDNLLNEASPIYGMARA